MCSNKGGDKTSGAQKPTNALKIENMNEAQINNEISKAKRTITRADKTMNTNDIINTTEARAMREAFPLGYGGRTAKQMREVGKINSRDAAKAKNYTDAYQRKQTAETRLKNLEKAKAEVKGTGKTQAQITAEKIKQEVKAAPKNMTWKTTNKGGWNNGGYTPKTIKSGAFEIRGESGYYTIYRNGKEIGRTDKLGKAKAYAEKLNARG